MSLGPEQRAHAVQFIRDYPTRADFLSAIHAKGAGNARALKAVRAMGAMFGVDLEGALDDIQNDRPAGNAWESNLLGKYEEVAALAR